MAKKYDPKNRVWYGHNAREWADHLKSLGSAGGSLPASVAGRLKSPEPPKEQTPPAPDSGPHRSWK
jgi:hypothetical protein